jgi:hypothetical protein
VTTLLALDPGAVHNGIAMFDDEHNESWRCYAAWEFAPEECENYLTKMVSDHNIDGLVVEQFNLYPDQAMAQTGSEMGTCERIGVVKYLARVYGVPLTMQPASIQKPTVGLLRVRGIKSMAKRLQAGEHALSAELHGWHAILRPELAQAQAK